MEIINSPSDNVGEISVGPWGGSGGTEWNFRAMNHAIKRIIIVHNNETIDSIMFKCDKDQYSKQIAGESGKGGTRTDKVDIDFPSEYLMGISGTYGPMGPNTVVRSLRFCTNLTEYGPFGPQTGENFSFRPNGAIITGFHGRSGLYIDCIGVYVKPVTGVFASVSLDEEHPQLVMSMGPTTRGDQLLLPRSPGPWGGNNGKEFDDGVFSKIKKVCVYLQNACEGNDRISGVMFIYEKNDGTCVSSPFHGSPSNNAVPKLFKIDTESEFLIGIEGYYGRIEGSTSCGHVIKSLTFHTNKGKYGPFGSEIGTFFTSLANEGKVLGFFGRSGAYLNAIGVHTEYF